MQHLTAKLILPTMVNVMSQEEDRCFQCHEQGHIACCCPNVRCFECEEYSHIVVDCPHRIPPSGTLTNHQQPRSHSRHMLDQARETTTKTDTSAADPDHKLISIIIEAQTITTHTEATPDHTIGSTEDTTGVSQNDLTPPLTTINPTMTHYTADYLHIEALPLTPEIAAGHTLDQQTHRLEEIHTDLLHTSTNHETKCISLGIQE